MEQNSVIIVVPCAALNEYVVECLRECARLDHDAYRIVLLPDAPVALPQELGSVPITVIPTGDVTIAAKRNAAIGRFPDAAYYAFIDSDAYPRRDWLNQGLASFTRGDRWAVGGPCLSPPDEPLLQRVVGNATRSVLVSGNLAFSKRVSASRYCLNLHSCNLIVSGQALRRIGGFHEELTTGEDREFCRRIRNAGGKIYFDRQVIVYHHNRRLGTHFFSQRVVHGHSIFGIMAADKGWYNVLLFVPLLTVALTGTVFLLGFAHGAGFILAGVLVGLYFVMAATAAVSSSSSPKEAALTLWAIITANAGYVIGSVAGLFRAKLDFKKLYANYRGPRGRRGPFVAAERSRKN